LLSQLALLLLARPASEANEGQGRKKFVLLLADGNISPGHTLYRTLHLITNLSQMYLSSKSWFSKFLLREARIIVHAKVTWSR